MHNFGLNIAAVMEIIELIRDLSTFDLAHLVVFGRFLFLNTYIECFN